MGTITAMNGDKEKILILPVKPVVQVNNYECGVACVQTILASRAIKSNRLGLKRQLHTSKNYGTLPKRIKEALSSYELKVREKYEANLADIEAELKKGRICLVVYQAWGAKYLFPIQSTPPSKNIPLVYHLIFQNHHFYHSI